MHEWLSILPSPHSQLTMNRYELTFSVSSPAESPIFVEFSPDGRFLAIGDQDSSLHILDELSGFHSPISTATPATPTALVWETSETFYVGLSDGRFIHYRIDLENNKLVRGAVNGLFHGSFPVTAAALDVESKTLVLSVGPDVFAFQRIHATSTFHSLMNQSRELTLLKVNSTLWPISRVASLLKEILGARLLHSQDLLALPATTCLSSPFVVRTSCEAHDHVLGSDVKSHSFVIRLIALEFGRDYLHSSFQTARM